MLPALPAACLGPPWVAGAAEGPALPDLPDFGLGAGLLFLPELDFLFESALSTFRFTFLPTGDLDRKDGSSARLLPPLASSVVLPIASISSKV